MNPAALSLRRRLPATVFLSALLAAPTLQATLVDNGDGTITDTNTNLMWAKDANSFATLYNAKDAAGKEKMIADILAYGTSFTDSNYGAITVTAADFNLGKTVYTDPTDGFMSIWAAKDYVQYLNGIQYQGYSDWRLPEIRPVNGSVSTYTAGQSDGSNDYGENFTLANVNPPGAWNPKNDEIGFLYNDSLGALSALDKFQNPVAVGSYGIGAVANNPFTNMKATNYWSSNEDPDPVQLAFVLGFNMDVGHMGALDKQTFSLETFQMVNGLSAISLVVRKAAAGTASAVLGTVADFGSQAVGSASPAQHLTLTNKGSANYAIASITASAEFAATHDCGGSLAAGKTCTIDLTFSPALAGARKGTLTVKPVSGTPLTASLSGTGTGSAPNLALGTNLDFGDQPVHAAGTPQAITLSNSGTADFAIGSIAASGDFSVASHTCGEKLAAGGASCTISVVLTPAAIGARSGSLTVTQAATGATVSGNLTGNGISAPHLTALTAGLDFGAVPNGKTALLPLILANDGTENLTVSGIAGLDSPFGKKGDSCSGKLLKPGKTCRIGVRFASSGGADPVTGTATVTAAGVNDLTVALAGRTEEQPGTLEVTTTGTVDIGFKGRFVVSGKEFGNKPGKLWVGSKPAKIVAWTNDTVVAYAPKLPAAEHATELVRKGEPRSGTGQVTVVVHAPEIDTEKTETSLAAGEILNIAGRYFGSVKPKIRFTPDSGGKPIKAAVLTGFTDNSVQVKVPARLKTDVQYGLEVRNAAGASSPATFGLR